MPDESFIDITYIIKEEIKKDEDKNIFYSQKHEIKNLLNLNLQINKQIEFNTENICFGSFFFISSKDILVV